MRVLLTNNGLAMRAGTELYLRDVALGLLERGHQPVVYSTVLGEVAEDLRQATVPVVDHLGKLTVTPDIIHGQHHLETVTALLQFPSVPALYVCHGWLPWVEAPPRLPRILRWIAVDDTVHDRLVLESGIPPDRVEVLLNFVDLARFRPRGPLPPRPARALVFSNLADESSHLPAVRRACRDAGIEVDAIGKRAGRRESRPEDQLQRYDLVFAKGRAALEALAVGCAVVLCDRAGAGPLVTADEMPRLRRLNFGIRALRQPVDVAWLQSQIRRYDPADTARASAALRLECGRETTIDALVALYEDLIEEFARGPRPTTKEEGAAFAEYLRALAPTLKDLHGRRRIRFGVLRRLASGSSGP